MVVVGSAHGLEEESLLYSIASTPEEVQELCRLMSECVLRGKTSDHETLLHCIKKLWECKKRQHQPQGKKDDSMQRQDRSHLCFLQRLRLYFWNRVLLITGSRFNSSPPSREQQLPLEESYCDPLESGQHRLMDEGFEVPHKEQEHLQQDSWSDYAVEWFGIRYARDDLPLFDSCNALRDNRSYNPNHALWLATASALAYRTPAQIRHVVTRIWGWEGIEFWNSVETDTRGYGMYGKECVIICFRGTGSRADWATNIRVSKIEPFIEFPQVKAHHGFTSALLSVLARVVTFIKKSHHLHPNLPVFITGHSLGGALANLCLAYYVLSSKHADISFIKGVYTFGQPKVGNLHLVEELNSRMGDIVFFRLTHSNDFIPLLPRQPSYVHCGTRIYLSHGHVIQGGDLARQFCRETSSQRMIKRNRQGMHDHVVRSYISFLRQLYELNGLLLASPSCKDVPLLRFHDIEQAKRIRDELRSLENSELVAQRLSRMSFLELCDMREVTITLKQRRKLNNKRCYRWIRLELWQMLNDTEDERLEKIRISQHNSGSDSIKSEV